MRGQNYIYGIFIGVTAVLLSGCASDQSKSVDAAQNNDGPTANASNGGAGDFRRGPIHSGPQLPPALVPNPSIVLFDRMSVVLDDKARQTITQLVERARVAKKVVVTGFCDQREIGNPSEAAVARAISVRDELLAQGIAAANLQVKFSTKTAKKHAAEIRFD